MVAAQRHLPRLHAQRGPDRCVCLVARDVPWKSAENEDTSDSGPGAHEDEEDLNHDPQQRIDRLNRHLLNNRCRIRVSNIRLRAKPFQAEGVHPRFVESCHGEGQEAVDRVFLTVGPAHTEGDTLLTEDFADGHESVLELGNKIVEVLYDLDGFDGYLVISIEQGPEHLALRVGRKLGH